MPALMPTIYSCSERCQTLLWLVANNRFDLLASLVLNWLKEILGGHSSEPTRTVNRRRIGVGNLCVILSTVGLLSGCSIRQNAVNLIGDALAGSGGVFASDDDPELIRQALPFGLKIFESLLEVSPNHRGLLLATARGFTAYAYLIQNRADRLDDADLREAQRLRARARRIFLRGRDYALRGVDARIPGFTAAFTLDRHAALPQTTIDDLPYLYWAGTAWAGALSAAKNDPDLLINLPAAGALVARVLQLDESYDFGAAHEFFIAFEAGRPGGSNIRAREHYRRAVELSRGQRASVHLALAESVAVKEQKLTEFRTLLETALSIDASAYPAWRLPNTVAIERAVWLQSRTQELFLEAENYRENPS